MACGVAGLIVLRTLLFGRDVPGYPSLMVVILMGFGLQMLAIGEETGMLDELLDEIGEVYSSEVEYSLKTLSQQIEPILVIFLGAIVLLLALGVFMPMWEMGRATIKH